MLRDFAFLGTQELRIFLDRHLVYQLVDFYLGDESPNARGHGQQPRKKMGDKFNSPMLTHMAETLSLLVRGCHTRASLHFAHNNATSGGVLMVPTTSEIPLQVLVALVLILFVLVISLLPDYAQRRLNESVQSTVIR